VVDLPGVSADPRAEQMAGTTARLEFYDWEANALTPNAKTVASQLQTQDPQALQDQSGLRGGGPGRSGCEQHDAL
jgi:hypothetical protein